MVSTGALAALTRRLVLTNIYTLDHGADASVQREINFTPLHWASERGHVEVALVLLNRGANEKARDKTTLLLYM